MAKQTGIHGLKGKVNGMSYYSSKNGGSLVRKINEGLGQRVKSSREYSNTRKNNAEFKACGSFAGAFIGAITSRWRFILNSIATGMMVKAAKAAIVLDAADKWGERIIQYAQFHSLQTVFNSLSKNPMPEVIASAISSTIKYSNSDNATKATANVEAGDELASELASIGADGFLLDFYHLKVAMPQFDSVAKAYTLADATLVHLDGLSQDVVNVTASTKILADGDSAESADYPTTDNEEMDVLFTLYRPYRTVGNELNVLQQHCAGMVSVPEVEE